MAKATQYKFDATKPFFAVVGAGDIAVEKARGIVTDVQDKVSTNVNKVERDPKALTEQARTLFSTRIDELTKDAKEAQAKVEAQIKDLQADAKALPGKVEAQLKDLQAELKALPAKVEAQLKDLQAELKALPSKVEAKYNEYSTKATDAAKEQFEQVNTFAARGEGVVAKLRGQEAKKAPASKPAAKQAPAKKAPAKKAPAKKAAAKKASA